MARIDGAGDRMSVSLEEGLERYDEAEARALRSLDRTGLALRNRPPTRSDGTDYDGRIPVNLGSLKPVEIGEYYNLQVAFTDYTSGLAVLARAEMLSAKEKLDLVLAAVRKSKSGTTQEKADLTTLDARYVDANANYIEAKTYAELIGSIAEGASRDARFISRIIETKRMDLDTALRGNSIDRIPQERPGDTHFRRRSTERPR